MNEKSTGQEKNTNQKKPQSDSQKAMNSIIGGLVFGVALAFLAYLIYEKIGDFSLGKILAYLSGFLAFICFAVVWSCFFDWKEAQKKEQLEAEAKKEEQEFSEITPDKRALRAEKLFRMNQKELMRYYTMNLAQTKFLSILGIVMIIAGIVIVLVSCTVYISSESDKMFLIVGNISGIIVDFIGAIFIKMYTQNLEAAVKFHAKFAESNNLLLANSIANKIENADLREQTLSDISTGIAMVKQSKTDE